MRRRPGAQGPGDLDRLQDRGARRGPEDDRDRRDLARPGGFAHRHALLSRMLRTTMNWLFKEEPSHYSFDDLVKDGRTRWSGVKNPLAQQHLRAVRKGDRILYYHTGGEKAVVGMARAVGDA